MNLVYTIAGTYRAAGMERILADKANWLAAHGHAVTIVTTEQRGRPEAFPLDPAIRRVDLGIGYEDNNGGLFLSKLLFHPFKQIRHRRRLSRLLRALRPDVTVSMFCGDEVFLPALRDGSRKVLEVHFSRFKRLQYGRKGLWALADRYRSRKEYKIVRRFEKFICLTEEDLGYWGRPANGSVIPNFLARFPAEPAPLDCKTVLAVGRYSYQKSYDRLLDAWKMVCRRLPSRHGWTLRLVGDGEEREALVRHARKLGVSGTVQIGGTEQDMDAVYRGASIFALSSRYEGLPMVLLEAQAYGLPIVAFRCPCGPADVVRDGTDGYLVPEGDTEALADRMVGLMLDPARVRRMGAEARKRSLRWDCETTMMQWIRLFEEILSSPR
jgi:glycosyltransferase involved in cell wall biosynthesis